jgi:hypothetical protein
MRPFTWSNNALEATAPRADSLVRDRFHHILVSVEAPLPGAVPQLSRWANKE